MLSGILGILLVIWSSLIRPALIALGKWRDEERIPTDPGRASVSRTRFLALAGAFLLLSVPLTLCWGIIQDGDMFYYSGWCNFAIYYFGLLIVLAEFSSVLAVRLARESGESRVWNLIERAVPMGVVVIVCVMHADRFRVRDPSPKTNRAMHESNLRIVADARARNPQGIRILDFPFFSWPSTMGLGLGLELQRQGQAFMAVDGFTVQFGQAHGLVSTTPQERSLIEMWHVKLGDKWKLWVSGAPKWFVPLGKLLEQQLAAAKHEQAVHGEVAVYPLLDDVELRVGVPKVSPVGERDVLDFCDGGNAVGCSFYGLSDPEKWGTWSDRSEALIRFRSVPVDPSKDVEMVFDTHPFLAPGANVTLQRMSVAANGTTLGPISKLKEDGRVGYAMPGALWNRTFDKSARSDLELKFPDAASPAKTNPEGDKDDQTLGVGFREIRFRTVDSRHSQPALDLDSASHEAEIDFKPGGNSDLYRSDGWYAAEPWGTWSNGHTSTLHFHSSVVDGMQDVEIAVDIHSVIATDSGILGQRIRYFWRINR